MSQAVQGYRVTLPWGGLPCASTHGPAHADRASFGRCREGRALLRISWPAGGSQSRACPPPPIQSLAGLGLLPHAHASLLLPPVRETRRHTQGHRPRHGSLSPASQGLAWPTCLDHPLGPWPLVRGLPFLLCQSANPGSRHTGSQVWQPTPLREAPQDLCPHQHLAPALRTSTLRPAPSAST